MSDAMSTQFVRRGSTCAADTVAPRSVPVPRNGSSRMILEATATEELNEDDTREPVVLSEDRRLANPLRMASCLVRYDLKKNCRHIHD